MRRRLLLGVGLVAAAFSGALAFVPARAQSPSEVRIDIRSDAAHRILIFEDALRPAGTAPPAATSRAADDVLANDLDASAVFTVGRAWAGAIAISDDQATIGGEWSVSGNQIKLTGQVFDYPAHRAILSRDYRGTVENWRSLVHRFADDVVQQFTGEPGVASTRIAFVAQTGRNKELWVMDADGARAKPLTADHSIALSPSWSPEGSLLLFTSYRAGTGPRVFVTPANGGTIYSISGRPGNNTAAAYSPDGREIACTLSQDGNPEIYVLDARGGSPRRLTTNRAIDTSPAWAPTARELAFTSDRDGTPQVYVMDRDGGNVRRLTYDVSYTDSPAWSPRGDQIAFVARTAEGFDLYVSRADGTGARAVVTGRSNENPRWSPDGRHLAFASNRDGEFGLYVTDLDDRPPRRIESGVKPAFSPAWSPRLAADASGARDHSP